MEQHLHQHEGHEKSHQHKHSNHCHQHNIRIPVTIIGGFLGAGKTTLVNHIISNTAEKRVDVLVREYGAVSIDDQLINLQKENIHVFTGGSIHQDPQLMLYEYLHSLYNKTGGCGFDHLLMEASGLDWPEHLVHLFFLGHLRYHYRIGSYITLVDAEYGHLNLDEYRIAREQIAYADAIIINKIDLAKDEEVESLERRLRNINSMAKIYRTSYGQVDISDVLDISLYEELKYLENSYIGKDEGIMDDIRTVVLTENRPMDKEKVNEWIQNLFDTRGLKILRSKGFFYFADEDYRYEFQAVRKTFHSKADHIWKEDEEKKSVVVLIGKELTDAEELQESFSSCAVSLSI